MKTIILILTLWGCATTQNSQQVEYNKTISLANKYARDGLYREALETYNKALKIAPQSKLVLRNIGIVQVKSNDFLNAIKSFEKVFPDYQQDFEYNFYFGEALRVTENYSAAIFRYQLASQASPKNRKSLKALSWAYYKNAQYNDALNTIRVVAKSFPTDEQAMIIQTHAMIKLGRVDDALKYVQASRQKVSKDFVPFFNSVEADGHFAKGDFAKAESLYKMALKEQPLLGSALLGLGKILLQKGSVVAATDYLERAVKVSPKMYEGLFFLAKSYEKQSPKKAVDVYKVFLAKAGKSPEVRDWIAIADKQIKTLTAKK